LKNFKISKTGKRFFWWRQAETDELIQDFLYELANDNNCIIEDLLNVYSFRTLNDILMRFNYDVQKIWIEAEKQGE